MKRVCKLFLFLMFLYTYVPDIPVLKAQDEMPSFVSAKTISMDLQDARLKDILKIFSMQSGLNFIASESVEEREVTLYLDKVPVKDAMDKIFKANNLSYDLDEKANIFIVKDWGRPELETITRVYYLKNRSVPSAKLEKEKENLFSGSSSSQNTAEYASSEGESGSTSDSTSRGVETKADIVTSLKQVLSPYGKIAEDIATNSLIITDVPRRFAAIEEVIKSLDIPQLQVMLDVEILDVSKDTADNLGFEFGASPLSLVLPGGDGSKFFIGDIAKIGAKGATSTTAGSVIFGSTYAQTLNFLRTRTDTRFLARPRLLTLNNETAEIAITKDEVVGQQQTNTVGTTSVNTTTFIRSTDLALTSEGTGVYLRVTPQINPDTNEITMAINPKSSVTTPSASIFVSQVDAEVRATKSIVKVKDGQTLILGGLINKDKKVVTKKIPFLGDIPFVGLLFQHKNQSKDIDRELLIFITPHILKDTNINLVQADKAVVSGVKDKTETTRYTSIGDFLDKLDGKR